MMLDQGGIGTKVQFLKLFCLDRPGYEWLADLPNVSERMQRSLGFPLSELASFKDTVADYEVKYRQSLITILEQYLSEVSVSKQPIYDTLTLFSRPLCELVDTYNTGSGEIIKLLRELKSCDNDSTVKLSTPSNSSSIS